MSTAANLQLGNAIRTHPQYQNTTNLALQAGYRYVFVQYEPGFKLKDVSKEMLIKDFTEWVYRVGTMASDYRHVRCTVIAPVVQHGTVVWQGTVWDLDDTGTGGVKKVAIHANPWVYNDPTRHDGIASGYVFYGITRFTDAQIQSAGELLI
jgi:hypothetical protein